MSKTVAAIILAAGRGERAGSVGPKQYENLQGEAIICKTVQRFVDCPSVGQIIVVIHKDDLDLAKAALQRFEARIKLVVGGATRQISTLAGLEYLSSYSPEFVHIHDAARPFITVQLLDNIHKNLSVESGTIIAIPISDTLKKVDGNNNIIATIKRDGLFSAQTPQTFPFSLIFNAHKKAHQNRQDHFTDDSALAEAFGIPVKVLIGSADNIKITWPEDFGRAQQIFAKQQGKSQQKVNCMYPDIRTGNGYDVHCFEAGDHVTLCGVDIPFDKKLSGHSDADVALHALTDALLATRGAGDIGTHFPPSDPQWRGAASHIFVRHAVSIVKQYGGRIANIDITLIAEAPKVGPHRDAMLAALSEMLGITKDRISVKATTNEKLGFIGRGEGIAAIATANVIYPGEVPL
ncbi:bifunctional 2-C-methyl-D-erythritol 4-phosphate cytidylyltransferase/2-C-methyl-D-erythritol 2,4-cyclodiphosphate synthase [Bartonella sp. HY329]|uniref:bifunctional 2-C-methyl-D-erythritol 4-phosphate cytidylyltransferase/2-C-methyl-D-erythritol 2,4-cyclodiphosphate synthase n=1 Tax=unclassified Bartonella TaxID=2645622 RepID=UPI0021C8245D|nr:MULTISPECIES: bifunctional 2-C-methyl-D-erythritol 4-phosphate cytidylyltransferase/2-C-methyl-D-erythritol 2,4-cyclodiphosphate synthase [unclassified Bartonella]UXM93880.1 bifunctional 2-C-methyl-D-erythritol 4-phosphate cytidylyltransferase/2-C-methyl-D-erythritol 2,4-cyclodiphosphate synthase [Bartonella sp. HY329]UXN08201.1 bifunctional 2-C-methyl-D-erythritol 4-phosphate cytidylyltransferase/2-C-methyl-D-erythritol 2,4-cyclodiphosphate synthase [Bartonella sp. HY328]